MLFGFEVPQLDDHLSDAQIERYVSRRAAVDELLETAQHLEKCWRCRDAAAALVDPGDSEVSHVRKLDDSGSGPRRRPSSPTWPLWIVIAILLVAIGAVWLWLRV